MIGKSIALGVCMVTAGGAAALSDDPAPRIIKPAPIEHPTIAPSDAMTLFDGTSMDGWTDTKGVPTKWVAEGKKGGAMTAQPGTGSIISTKKFSDAQIHVEFSTPAVEMDKDGKPVQGQDRGNSGVYLQGRYEVQVLDSFENSTYPNGQCGAIYGQHAPLVNVSRPPMEWQTYDIIFRAPRFDAAGKKTANARVTVLHNGVLIHDNVEITGPTGGSLSPESAEPGPLLLQEHGNFVRYRNVWVRELGTR